MHLLIEAYGSAENRKNVAKRKIAEEEVDGDESVFRVFFGFLVSCDFFCSFLLLFLLLVETCLADNHSVTVVLATEVVSEGA